MIECNHTEGRGDYVIVNGREAYANFCYCGHVETWWDYPFPLGVAAFNSLTTTLPPEPEQFSYAENSPDAK